MEPTVVAVIISAVVTAFGLLVGYIQWRRDVKIKMGQIRETVSVELIRQRINPYGLFFQKLEMISSLHKQKYMKDRAKIHPFRKELQKAIYGNVGMLASHETRQLLIYVRSGCNEYLDDKIPFEQLRMRIWALHLSLRSDLGISQPNWLSEIERVRTDAAKYEFSSWEKLVESYPWDNIDAVKDRKL